MEINTADSLLGALAILILLGGLVMLFSGMGGNN